MVNLEANKIYVCLYNNNAVEEGSQKRRGSIFKNRNQYDYLHEENVNNSRKLIIEQVQGAILDAGTVNCITHLRQINS